MGKLTASAEAQARAAGKPPRENLYRATSDIGLTRAADAAMPTLTGHFAVWNQWTEIRSAFEGHFLERFAPGAMTKTLSESTPKVLFQHGKDPQIGDKPLGPISRVEPDDTGAYYEVPLLDTSYNRDLLPGLEAGLYGASFRFSVLREDVVQKPRRSEYNPNGLPERTVQEAKVMEFGPVTFPAYAGATAGIRSLTDEFLMDTLLEQRPELVARRAGVSLAGLNIPAERFDNSDIGCLAQMITSASCYLDEQDEADDGAAITAMQGVVKTLTGLLQTELDEDEPDEPDDQEMPMMGMYSADSGGEDRAQWTTAYIDGLPDSAFLHVEAGGTKDSEGKTTPRSLRHFPYKDASGNVDLPHLQNALSRIPQSSLPQSVKDAATAKAQKILAAQNGRATEPGLSGATTHVLREGDVLVFDHTKPGIEPEPSEATTRDSHDLFWFVEPPKHMRGGKK